MNNLEKINLFLSVILKGLLLVAILFIMIDDALAITQDDYCDLVNENMTVSDCNEIWALLNDVNVINNTYVTNTTIIQNTTINKTIFQNLTSSNAYDLEMAKLETEIELAELEYKYSKDDDDKEESDWTDELFKAIILDKFTSSSSSEEEKEESQDDSSDEELTVLKVELKELESKLSNQNNVATTEKTFFQEYQNLIIVIGGILIFLAYKKGYFNSKNVPATPVEIPKNPNEEFKGLDENDSTKKTK